jgi:hypothetical protein
MRPTFALLAFALAGAAAHAQPTAAASASTAGYHNSARLNAAFDSIARAKPTLVRVSVLATSPGNRAVQLVRVGSGANVDDRPALLVVGNANGQHVLGSEIALRTVRSLASRYGSDTAITRLLDRATLYVVPRANPDAAESFFGSLRHERMGNDMREDDDRDAVVDEDPPNDLNGDGMITMMRITDPAGEWIADPVNPELMRRADATKGEVGRFRVLVEGIDDDKDEQFNEDGPGGVDVGKNFPHKYEWFRAGSGVGPLATPEARALAQLFADRPNIAAVYVIGLHDNVIKPWEGRTVPGIANAAQGTSAGGPFTSSLPADNPWFAETSRRFRTTTGLGDGAPTNDDKGGLVSFAYYGMGRLAFASRGWWVPKIPADTAAARRGPALPTPDPLADERNALRWAQANNRFVNWTEVRSDAFAGKKVEVGGFAPYAQLNPAGAELDSVAAKQTRFIGQLAGMLPAISLREVTVEPLGARVFRISAQVANDGYLPTLAAMGTRARWPRRVRVDLTTTTGQQIVSGRAVQQLDAIRGSGASSTVSWTVIGDPGSTVTLKAESPVAGSATQTITLRAR